MTTHSASLKNVNYVVKKSRDVFEQRKGKLCRVPHRVRVLYLVKSGTFMCLAVTATSPTHHKHHTVLLNLGTPLLISYLADKCLMDGRPKK